MWCMSYVCILRPLFKLTVAFILGKINNRFKVKLTTDLRFKTGTDMPLNICNSKRCKSLCLIEKMNTWLVQWIKGCFKFLYISHLTHHYRRHTKREITRISAVIKNLILAYKCLSDIVNKLSYWRHLCL